MPLSYKERISSPPGYRAVFAMCLSIIVALAAWPISCAAVADGITTAALLFTGLWAGFYGITTITYCTRIELGLMSTFKGKRYVFQARGVHKGMRPDIPCSDIEAVYRQDFDGVSEDRAAEAKPVILSQPGYRGGGVVIRYRFTPLIGGELRRNAIQVPTTQPVQLIELLSLAREA